MLSFFKTILFGLLYLVTLPLMLAFLVIVAVYNVITVLVLGIKNIFVYFLGGDPFKDLPEDIKAREVLESRQVKAAALSQAMTNSMNAMAQQTIVNQTVVPQEPNVFEQQILVPPQQPTQPEINQPIETQTVEANSVIQPDVFEVKEEPTNQVDSTNINNNEGNNL